MYARGVPDAVRLELQHLQDLAVVLDLGAVQTQAQTALPRDREQVPIELPLVRVTAQVDALDDVRVQMSHLDNQLQRLGGRLQVVPPVERQDQLDHDGFGVVANRPDHRLHVLLLGHVGFFPGGGSQLEVHDVVVVEVLDDALRRQVNGLPVSGHVVGHFEQVETLV